MQDKPAFISTPARMITMEYNSKAPLSRIESEALDKYKELHTRFLPLFDSWKALETDYREAVKLQRPLRHELFYIEQDVKLYRQLAGFTEEEMAEMPELEDELELDPNELYKKADDFKDKFDTHDIRVQNLIDRFKEIQKHTDIMKELYEDFDKNYFSKIMADHENMEINVIRFDEDYNEFNVLMDELSDYLFSTADEHKALIVAFNELVATMDLTFKRIDKIAEEVEKLKADGMDGIDPELN